MDLRSIQLEQVTQDEFVKLHDIWVPEERRNRRNHNTIRILAPLKASDYMSLILSFLESKYKDRISVKSPQRWVKYYPRRMRIGDVYDISAIAEADKFKGGALELYFKTSFMAKDNVSIRFTKTESGIIGYKMFFPSYMRGLFSWKSRPNLDNKPVYGLWKPDS